jgi:hypothetical protein
MLGELIDPVFDIATSLVAFTNISFLHYVRNGTVE